MKKAASVYRPLVGLSLACCRIIDSLEVVTPAKGDVLVAERPYTVKWTGSSGGRVHVDLHVCTTPNCTEDSCGEFVSSLCPLGVQEGCPYELLDGYGHYDVVLPGPIKGSSFGYTVYVTEADDETNVACSGHFHHVDAANAPGTGGFLRGWTGQNAVFRVQQRGLIAAAAAAAVGTEYVPRTAYEADGSQERGECEVALLTVEDFRDAPVKYTSDLFENILGSWRLLDSFGDGSVCGDVSDRTTSVAVFDSALARRDGSGLGNLLFLGVAYEGIRIPYDSAIRSSLLSARAVSSVGTPTAYERPIPNTMSYNGPFFSAHVNIHQFWSLPVLFHTPSLCQGADVTLDFYSAAALGYVHEIGGDITNYTTSNTTSEVLNIRSQTTAVVFNDETFDEFEYNQLFCDLAEEPSDGPAGWAECSDGTRYVNTSVLVGGCEVLVSPARWIVVGDYTDQTPEGIAARISLWYEQVLVQVPAVLQLTSETTSAMITATNPYQISTTQIGLPLDVANDNTQWLLVLIVAVEAVVVVVALSVSSCFDNMRLNTVQSKRPLSLTRAGLVLVAGKVVSVAVVLILGLIPVFVARGSEFDADNMAHNDVYSHYTEKTLCYIVVWVFSDNNQWCVTTRVSSHSLLVRSYQKTFLRRYDVLVVTAISVGAVALVSYAVLNVRKAVVGRSER